MIDDAEMRDGAWTATAMTNDATIVESRRSASAHEYDTERNVASVKLSRQEVRGPASS